ncbi:MAG: hypothetical protein WDW36_003561 [Sanguina aurantia]
MSRTVVFVGLILSLSCLLSGSDGKTIVYKDTADLVKRMHLTSVAKVLRLANGNSQFDMLANSNATVFLPTNAAFAKYLKAHRMSLKDFSMVAAVDLAQSVILGTPYKISSFPVGSSNFTNVFGEPIVITRDNVKKPRRTSSYYTVFGPLGAPAKIVTQELVAGLSRVYIIDTILEFVTPPDVTAGGGLSSLPAALGAQPELSFLVQVIAATLHAAELPSLTATLFAPTNAAFDALAKSFGMSDRTGLLSLPLLQLQDLLGNHVLFGPGQTTSMFTDGEMLTMASKQNVTIHTANGTVTVSSAGGSTAHITVPDIMAGTSVIQVIDSVLVPASPPPAANNTAPDTTGGSSSAIAQAIAAHPELTFLIQALGATPFASALATVTLTLFAPTNAAFDALAKSFGMKDRAGLLSLPLTQNVTIHTANGTVTVSSAGGSTAHITIPDIMAGNSVIQVIDSVLLPASSPATANTPAPANATTPGGSSPSLAAVIGTHPELAFLVQALGSSPLAAALASSPLTLFAPTNAAFDVLSAQLGLPNRSALLSLPPQQLLLLLAGHAILGRAVTTSMFTDGEMITVGSKQNVTIHKTNGTFTVSSTGGSIAHITSPDIMVGPAVIQVIDSVLLPYLPPPANSTAPATSPPTNTTSGYPSLAYAIAAHPELNFLLQALQATPYAAALPSVTITLFAPTNAAWDALAASYGQSNRTALLSLIPQTQLAALLSNHVIFGPGQTTSTFTDGEMLTMASTQNVTIHTAGGAYKVSSAGGSIAHITNPDIMAGTSVIQVIDAVLLPSMP